MLQPFKTKPYYKNSSKNNGVKRMDTSTRGKIYAFCSISKQIQGKIKGFTQDFRGSNK